MAAAISDFAGVAAVQVVSELPGDARLIKEMKNKIRDRTHIT